MPAFDTHCHLGLLPYDPDPDATHARARAAAVTHLLVAGVDAASSAHARTLAQRLPDVRWSAGLHPNSADRWDQEAAALRALAADPGCAAIGETGLDRFHQRVPLPVQQHAFALQLQWARALELPVIIHSRDAFPETFAVLRPFGAVRGVMHCFSGTIAEARTALDLGLHLSFAGPLTYKNNDALRQAAAFVPKERLLVETDAPFLPPQPQRGQRNEPAFLLATLAVLAEVRSITMAAAMDLSFDNGCALFARRPGRSQRGPAP